MSDKCPPKRIFLNLIHLVSNERTWLGRLFPTIFICGYPHFESNASHFFQVLWITLGEGIIGFGGSPFCLKKETLLGFHGLKRKNPSSKNLKKPKKLQNYNQLFFFLTRDVTTFPTPFLTLTHLSYITSLHSPCHPSSTVETHFSRGYPAPPPFNSVATSTIGDKTLKQHTTTFQIRLHSPTLKNLHFMVTT